MKKIIFFIIFTITIHSLWSQSTERFVKRFDDGTNYLTLRNIAVTDSAYVLIGSTSYFGGIPKAKLTLYFFDSIGNLTNKKYYLDTNYNYGYYIGKHLKMSNDGNYICNFSSFDYSQDISLSIFYKFLPTFDTIWSISFDYHLYMDAYDIAEDTSGNLILVGTTGYLDNGDTTTTPYLGVIKMDTLGNIIWQHCYDTLVYGDGEFVWVDKTNNHYWIGGKVNYHPGIYELDEDGNLLWLHEFPSDYYMQTDAMNLTLLPQPYGVLAYRDRLWAQLDRAAYSAIIKNNSINKEWYYAPGLSANHEVTGAAIVSADNNMYITEGGGFMHNADSVIPITTTYNYIYKLTLDGRVMWRRKMFDMYDYANFGYYPGIIDLETTPDGGFIGTGWGSDSVYFGILAKFDSLGCNGYYSCADTAMVLNLLSPIDSVCLNDTLWMNFHLDGLSAPYTLYSSTGDTISGIYHTMSPTVFSSSTLTDSTQYISYDIYQQYGFVPPDTNTGTYHLTITLEGSYGRRLSHTYDIPVKNCSTGVVEPDFAQLNIFPNPATGGVVNIEATLNKPAFLSLYDNTGKSIQTMRLEPGTHTYQIKQQLPEGIYFVSIWNEKGSVVKKLLITNY